MVALPKTTGQNVARNVVRSIAPKRPTSGSHRRSQQRPRDRRRVAAKAAEHKPILKRGSRRQNTTVYPKTFLRPQAPKHNQRKAKLEAFGKIRASATLFGYLYMLQFGFVLISFAGIGWAGGAEASKTSYLGFALVGEGIFWLGFLIAFFFGIVSVVIVSIYFSRSEVDYLNGNNLKYLMINIGYLVPVLQILPFSALWTTLVLLSKE